VGVALFGRTALPEERREDELAFDFFIRPQYTAGRETMAIWNVLLQSSSAKVRFRLPGRDAYGSASQIAAQPGEEEMPKYVIERDIPKIGDVTTDQVIAISQKSCSVLNNLGPTIQWLHSYVTQDKIYCVYIAPNEEMVREHARQGGFPANRVSEVKMVIDPTSAET
jgi:uncharacterized protein DUF4242